VTRTIFFFRDIRDCRKMGMGIMMIMRSDEMFRTAFVIRWLVAAEHCADVSCQSSAGMSDVPCRDSRLSGGTAQYWLKGLHHTPRYRISITTKPTAT